jgi:septal ring factor EnvC (AmiA/AmiB activator)
MSQIAQMTALLNSLPSEAKEALGFLGDVATLQQEHAQLQQEVVALRTNRDQLDKNLSHVMKRDEELLQEVRDLRGALSRMLLCLKTDEMGVHTVALVFATRSTEWCTACNGDHPVLLNDADLYVICPKTFPHRKARGY